MRAWRRGMFGLLGAAAALACGDAAAPAGAGRVTLRFRMAGESAAMHTAGGGLSLSRMALAALPFEGTNGTLTLDQVWLVVRRVSLTPAASSCADAGGDNDAEESAAGMALHGGDPEGEAGSGHDDDCDVHLGPFFVPVPLDGDGGAEVAVDVVPGTYHEVALKVSAVGDDGGADLLAEVRDQFPDWPDVASMLVTGSFTPSDGDAIPFRVYFHARIEVEREFEDDPLTVEEGGDLTVTVVVDPGPWFTNPDGTVDDLTVYDFDATGAVAEFGMRSGEGCRIEREHD